ncbi:MAG: SDR family oxidoreductase [Bacteroidales bacterium]|nr:SDR family oxidoreductase [Bacteroidales bacterium]
MKGKTVLITGATDGIGKRTAVELAKLGASVIIHGRNRARGKQALAEIGSINGNGSVSYENADLASLSQLKNLVGSISQKHEKLDVLINNAGVFTRGQSFSDDGFEMTFAVNHLAHFALSLQLLPLLKMAEQGRIITVSSIAHTNSPRIDFSDIREINSYIDYSAYALSKLANVMFSNELAEKLKKTSITSNSLHPGVITTKLLYEGFGISGSTVDQGCRTSVFLASHKSLSGTSGKYFSDSNQVEPSAFSYDPNASRNLWALSEEMSGIRFDYFK